MNIKTIQLEVKDSDIFRRLTLEGEEVTKLVFSKQIDDVMISCEDEDILLRWDSHDWIEDECMLLKTRDNFKEIGGLNCTILLLKSKTGQKATVYMVAQLN